MRTDEQISNLRRAFYFVYGPIAFIASREQINFLADKLQRDINAKKYYWIIKTKTEDTLTVDWSMIEEEGTRPYCSNKKLEESCKKLLEKYPLIICIGVKTINDSDDQSLCVYAR